MAWTTVSRDAVFWAQVSALTDEDGGVDFWEWAMDDQFPYTIFDGGDPYYLVVRDSTVSEGKP